MTQDVGPFAKTIMNQKYAHELDDGSKETWEQIGTRVATNVLESVKAPKSLIKRAEKLIQERKFMPAGRYLYSSGRPFHQVQNCYGGETEVVTSKGTFLIKDLPGSNNGKHTIMTTKGQWIESDFKCFGNQELYKVTLGFGQGEKVIYATGGHSWRTAGAVSVRNGRKHFLDKRELSTIELSPGDTLWQVFGYGISRTPVSAIGVMHGFVWGDGNKSTQGHQSTIRLCGKKDQELQEYFSLFPQRPVEDDIEISGLPSHFKTKVPLDYDRSYLLGWLAGYFAADGCVSKSGKVTLASHDRKSLEHVKDICYLLGIGCNQICSGEKVSNLDGKKYTHYSVSFDRATLDERFFLISSHKERWENNQTERQTYWKVKSVEKTLRNEPVYCAVVPDTHEFTLADNILTGNCLLLKAEDSREGWADAAQKATMALMTGAGIGIVYSSLRPEGAAIRKTGGTATGPIALMQMINELGRGIMQGGSRRSAIWAGLHWNHADIHKFIRIKDWTHDVRKLKEKDFTFPATMDGTNVSVILDDEFFLAFHDEEHEHHALALSVYWATVRQMLKTGEPGFSVDTGVNAGEHLRNAPVCKDTHVLTRKGYQTVNNLIGVPSEVWTGKQWAKDVVFKETSSSSDILLVELTGGRSIRCDSSHPFMVERYSGHGDSRKLVSTDRVGAKDLSSGDIISVSLPEIAPDKKIDTDSYVLGYVYGDGSFSNQGKAAEITFCTDESKECIPLIENSTRLSSINPKDSRGFVRAYFKTDKQYWGDRSKDVFPEDLFKSSPEESVSFIAGLFDANGNWEPGQKRIRLSNKNKSFLRGVSRLLEQIGILSSVSKNGFSTYGKSQTYQLVIASSYAFRFEKMIPTNRVKPDTSSYKPYRESDVRVVSVTADGTEPVYCCDVGVDEHTFMAEGVIISNCCEISSSDDSDICNLGSINMAKINSLEEMKEAVEVGTAFLLAGTVYSDVPYPKVDQTRTKNRRLGLGLMGLHEWLLKRGKKYGEDKDLEQYLEIYKESTSFSKKYAKKWDLSVPVKTRAIAPTGTIGIVAETTTGIEPIFCVAYKRRYLKGTIPHYQYVVDPCANRLIQEGVDPEHIEDAYTLAEDIERRVAFQAWLQGYVDHAISSTLNLPSWGSTMNSDDSVQLLGNMFIKYLPRLRGVTCYPDGARGGQPLTPVKYSTAMNHVGEIFIEQADVCDITKAGSCG